MVTIVLLAILLAASILDVGTRRIPNRLILLGLGTGCILHLLPTVVDVLSRTDVGLGPVGLFSGIAVGFICMLPLYALRAMGAGDVKLMMMVGAFLGPTQTLGVVVLTFAAGGVLAICMALWQRTFRQLVTNLRFMLTTSAVRAAGGGSARFEPLAQTAGRMPYAVAIAAGTVLQLILVRSGGWALS